MRRALLTIFVLATLIGCATTRRADPLAVMLDRESDYSHRRAAAQQAQRDLAGDPRYGQTLRQIIWDSRYPAWQRIDAIDALLALDERAARRELAARIMQLPERQSLNHVVNIAAARDWTDYTGPLVRSWSRIDRHTPDERRPERQALLALHSDREISAILMQIFINADEAFTLSHQLAAWDVLNRIADAPALLEASDPPPGTLAHEFLAARLQLHVLPRTRDEALWLLHLREPQRRAWWDAAAAAVARLNAEQRESLQLRHLPLLVALKPDDPVWQWSRGQLVAEVERAIGEHQPVAAELYDVAQPVRDWGERLCWSDLLALRTLVEVLRDDEVVAALFRQADADLKENETEFGGAMLLHEGRYVAQMHMPLRRRGDYVFVPPQGMIEELYTGLFHYHFHAQKQDNREHAAPGNGDLAVANRLNFNFIVLTAIGPDELNVDYYQRDGVVVDIANLRRR